MVLYWLDKIVKRYIYNVGPYYYKIYCTFINNIHARRVGHQPENISKITK